MANFTIQNYSHTINNLHYWNCICKCGDKIILSYNELQNKFEGCIRCKDFGGKIPPYQYIYNQYKNNAKKRKIEFNLSIKEFKSLIESECIYCGMKDSITNIIGGKSYSHNGIDRLINTQGYDSINSLTCCKICNRAKNNATVPEFHSWIMNLVKYKNAGK
jgi:hypothetical protein